MTHSGTALFSIIVCVNIVLSPYRVYNILHFQTTNEIFLREESNLA